MTAYYNEFDPNAALWLWELIEMGLIAPGIIDERSIVDVDWRDLHGFTQCHFFAGIGGWSYALRLAGIPDNTPLWTASLPCQPFSAAGKGLGKQDERHLLPHFLELIKQRKPDTIFGEQVERAIGHGWLDDLQTTMEAEGYAIGHCVLGAHSVNAAHIRQRLYWVADYYGERLEGRERTECTDKLTLGENRLVDGMANASSDKRKQQQNERPAGLFGTPIQSEECISRPCDTGAAFSRLGISNSSGSQQRIETTETARHGCSVASAGGVDWLYCRDNKYRPIESGLKPLVDGVPRGVVHSSDPRNTQEARAMRLKGYGNAIVPQVAAEFIRAFYDIKPQ